MGEWVPDEWMKKCSLHRAYEKIAVMNSTSGKKECTPHRAHENIAVKNSTLGKQQPAAWTSYPSPGLHYCPGMEEGMLGIRAREHAWSSGKAQDS